jgi:hypothetical protein
LPFAQGKRSGGDKANIINSPFWRTFLFVCLYFAKNAEKPGCGSKGEGADIRLGQRHFSAAKKDFTCFLQYAACKFYMPVVA